MDSKASVTSANDTTKSTVSDVETDHKVCSEADSLTDVNHNLNASLKSPNSELDYGTNGSLECPEMVYSFPANTTTPITDSNDIMIASVAGSIGDTSDDQNAMNGQSHDDSCSDAIEQHVGLIVGQIISDCISDVSSRKPSTVEKTVLGDQLCPDDCMCQSPSNMDDASDQCQMHAYTIVYTNYSDETDDEQSSCSDSSASYASNNSLNQCAKKTNGKKKKKNNRKKSTSSSPTNDQPLCNPASDPNLKNPDSVLSKPLPVDVNANKVQVTSVTKAVDSAKSTTTKLNGVHQVIKEVHQVEVTQANKLITHSEPPSLSHQCSVSSLASQQSSLSDSHMDDSQAYEYKWKPNGGCKAYGPTVNGGDSVCKICGKHVYHMEQIKAVKSVFHKSCFRCIECNKQLNVDSYSSHEGIIYCKPHFKQLFQPKAVFDSSDESKTKPNRKYELIICENTPQELPADVIRCNTKQDIFENLNLDLSNIRNRFENGGENKAESQPKRTCDKSITRSESVHKIMQKYQNRVAGDKDLNSSSDEEDVSSEANEVKEEKIAFSGMSALKSQWETGSINGNSKSDSRSVEDELAELRSKSKISEPLKQVYERAIQEAKSSENLSLKSDTFVVDSSVRAVSIKEKFENRSIDMESEEDRIERLRREREEEIIRIAESETCTKEARNRFKQIDANMGKDQVHSSNGFNDNNNAKEKEIDDIPKVDTTKKMLDKFKALEAGQGSGEMNGVAKSPKRITPPREIPKKYESEPVVERDPNIVKSSYKTEDDIQVEPEKAKNLRAKFENWQSEIERENRKNNEDDEEYIPHIDTTKNLRAMFESINDDSKLMERPRPRVNRFVDNKSSVQGEVCYVCNNRLYPMEKMEFSGIKIHKNCFRCNKCHTPLRLDNFTVRAEKLFCIPHFKQMFMEKGNYDEGFGLEQHKDKWSNKGANCKANGVVDLVPNNGNDLIDGNGHMEPISQ